MTSMSFIFRRFQYLFFLIVCVSSLSAQAPEKLEIRTEIEQDLAAFRLQAVVEKTASLRYPGYRAFYKSHALMYKYIASQNPKALLDLRGSWKDHTDAILKLSDADPLKYVLMSELFCKRAGLEFLDGNYLSAVRFARLGRNYALKNQNRFPDNVEQLKILGIFNIVFGAVPQKYQWITQSLGFKGNITEGFQQLEKAASGSKLLRTEVALVAAYIQKYILGDAIESLNRLEKLRQEQPNVLMVDYFSSVAYISLKENEKALEILNQRDKYIDSSIVFVPFWDYQLGKAYYFKGQHREAQRFLARFLKYHQGDIYKTDAIFRLGMSLTLDGNYQAGRLFFKRIAEGSHSLIDEDEYADFMAKKFLAQAPAQIDRDLFLARNFYDGGYLTQAIGTLQALSPQQNTFSHDQEIEWNYRFARIYHSLNQMEAARNHYQKCTVPSPTDQRWMQAYAYYYLGEMARQSEDLTLAKSYYQKAMGFDGYFYQSGLENRCKIRLSEIRKVNHP